LSAQKYNAGYLQFHIFTAAEINCLSGLLNYCVRYFLSASGNLPRVVLFVNNHKNRNQPWTAVFIF